MGGLRPLALVLLLGVVAGEVRAGPLRFCTARELRLLNDELCGHLCDFTFNHGVDRRFYSPALDSKRDLYVYLPPGYDPSLRYPIVIWLHGYRQDEKNFLDIVTYFDRAMACGRLPPFLIAAPDGSVRGRPTFFTAGSFYVNSNAGRFEDYIAQDVWGFVTCRFPVRPEREAHALAGASMGGFGAYNLGIKYRDRFGLLAGIHPPLHLRYLDCRGRYFANFDPGCLGIREQYQPLAPVGRFLGGVITIRQWQLMTPLYGGVPDPIPLIARENPLEMLDLYQVMPGELQMYVGYGTQDQFNIDAQVESFVHFARRRGLEIMVHKVPGGKHDFDTGVALFPSLRDWLAPRLAPYSPAARPAAPAGLPPALGGADCRSPAGD
ncbi:MAG TPA: alpha/beta hydrolase-fold protein [Gemmataceae bacterium]